MNPIHEAIKAAGGSVHKDGNIFFTNQNDFLAACGEVMTGMVQVRLEADSDKLRAMLTEVAPVQMTIVPGEHVARLPVFNLALLTKLAVESKLIYEEDGVCFSPWIEDADLTPYLDDLAKAINAHILLGGAPA